MKKTVKGLKKLIAVILSMALTVMLLSVIPVVEAEEPAFSAAFVQKLLTEHPLAEGQIYVGYGIENITPKAIRSDGYTGVPLAGYGREEYRIGYVGGSNAAVQQDVYATCTAVMDREGNIIIFNVNDITRSTLFGAIRKRISEYTGVPEEKIFVSGTHTHSGPASNTNSVKV